MAKGCGLTIVIDGHVSTGGLLDAVVVYSEHAHNLTDILPIRTGFLDIWNIAGWPNNNYYNGSLRETACHGGLYQLA